MNETSSVAPTSPSPRGLAHALADGGIDADPIGLTALVASASTSADPTMRLLAEIADDPNAVEVVRLRAIGRLLLAGSTAAANAPALAPDGHGISEEVGASFDGEPVSGADQGSGRPMAACATS